jgi:hypothetical protein
MQVWNMCHMLVRLSTQMSFLPTPEIESPPPAAQTNPCIPPQTGPSPPHKLPPSDTAALRAANHYFHRAAPPTFETDEKKNWYHPFKLKGACPDKLFY